jgi:hypothetical protein
VDLRGKTPVDLDSARGNSGNYVLHHKKSIPGRECNSHRRRRKKNSPFRGLDRRAGQFGYGCYEPANDANIGMLYNGEEPAALRNPNVGSSEATHLKQVAGSRRRQGRVPTQWARAQSTSRR